MPPELPSYNVFVSGLSNSIMREGYVKGIENSTQGHVENISLGASNCGMGLWMLRIFEAQIRAADVVLLDYFIMDYQTDPGYITRDLPLLLRGISRFSRPVVLLWPDKLNMQTPVRDKISVYADVCAAEGCLLIDCRELARDVMARHGLSNLDELFQDAAHIHPRFAYEMGIDIARRIESHLSYVDRQGYVHVQIVAPENGPIVGPPWLKIPVTSLPDFLPEVDGELIGMMILTKSADFEIRVDGRSRRVWTYWAPDDPNPPQILRYISIDSVPVRKGQPVRVETWSKDELVDGMMVHSVVIRL